MCYSKKFNMIQKIQHDIQTKQKIKQILVAWNPKKANNLANLVRASEKLCGSCSGITGALWYCNRTLIFHNFKQVCFTSVCSLLTVEVQKLEMWSLEFLRYRFTSLRNNHRQLIPLWAPASVCIHSGSRLKIKLTSLFHKLLLVIYLCLYVIHSMPNFEFSTHPSHLLLWLITHSFIFNQNSGPGSWVLLETHCQRFLVISIGLSLFFVCLYVFVFTGTFLHSLLMSFVIVLIVP